MFTNSYTIRSKCVYQMFTNRIKNILWHYSKETKKGWLLAG
ncbi:hypothetical protein HMPREF0645_0767 [Hallella bergensis DSM 17361]|uniref:Uncharacterized protein n=1 Tax=Hallella bergensis DSM 17361 TaxID=585502 RepID=D1PUY2_9BACT|nr:hypothetical protein HMPREF0645_0767 [Hallella bergensis DSM 17361]